MGRVFTGDDVCAFCAMKLVELFLFGIGRRITMGSVIKVIREGIGDDITVQCIQSLPEHSICKKQSVLIGYYNY